MLSACSKERTHAVCSKVAIAFASICLARSTCMVSLCTRILEYLQFHGLLVSVMSGTHAVWACALAVPEVIHMYAVQRALAVSMVTRVCDVRDACSVGLCT